jgi:HK97 family phage major capsid protein
MNIQETQDRLLELQADCETILAAAAADKRDALTEQEQEQMDSLLAEIKAKGSDLARMQAVEENAKMMSQSSGRKAPPEDPRDKSTDTDDDEPDASPKMKGNGKPPERHPRVIDNHRGRWGWNRAGDYMAAVRNACIPGGQMDNRLAVRMDAPTTYGSSVTGADGGFAIPPDFREEIMIQVTGEDSLLSRTDQLTSSSNSITVPKDETTPWQDSGGIQATWTGEGQQKAQSKPVLEQETVHLHKLTVLVPVTDELLADASALGRYVMRKAPDKINFKVNLAILQGSGAGQPLGIINSGAAVVVSKQSSQLADTVVAQNIIDMHARLYASSMERAVWLVNQDVLPMIHTLALPGKDNTGAAATDWGTHMYVPPGGLSNAPFGTLLGRPIIPTQAAPTLGSKGDIILADLGQYMTVMKSGGIRSDVSIHLWFDYDITAFRFVLRLGGQPWWDEPVDPLSGSNTLSPFVVLEERA